MLRLRLDPADLAGTRFAVSPLNQVVMYTTALASERSRSAFVSHARFAEVAAGSADARQVLRLIRARPGNRPDFLTPAPRATADPLTIDDELDVIRATAPEIVAAELAGGRGLPERRLRDADVGAAATRLADGLLWLQRGAFRAGWPRAAEQLHVDIAQRVRELAVFGIGHVLNRLNPRITFDHGVLTLHSERDDPEEVSSGHGLVLVPSAVASRTITVKINDRDPIVLIYPIRQVAVRPSAAPSIDQLAGAFGRARAAVIIVLASQPILNTSQVAQRAGLAVSSASEHLHLLRRAGIVDGWRERNIVFHQLSPAGRRIADGVGLDPAERG